jgi:hypothetical protein
MRMPRRSSGLIAPLLLLAAACADHPTPTAAPSPLPGADAALLECRADVRAATMSCAAAEPALPGGVSAAVLGGQGVNVRLRNTGVAYENGVFRTDVTVENLVAQALGTADGVTPSPDGVRVFFSVAPHATRGQGEVTVANPDGQAYFTAANQDFFRYAGILAPSDTSPPREWRFATPASVEAFSFQVLVTGAVAREAGWIAVSPPVPALAVGDTMRLTATVHSVTGRPVQGAAVQWNSSDPSIVAVGQDGTVTALKAGTAIVTATSNGRRGSVRVNAFTMAAWDGQPTVRGVSFSPSRINADGLDSVTLEAHITDEVMGVDRVSMGFDSPTERHFTRCNAYAPASGTRTDGVFRCRAAIDEGAEDGTWGLFVAVSGEWGRVRQWADAQRLDSAGVQTSLYVRSAYTDSTPPSLLSVSSTPDTVIANGVDSVTFTMQVTDEGAGVGSAGVELINHNDYYNLVFASCSAHAPVAGTRNAGTFQCRIAFPPGSATGFWEGTRVILADQPGNRSELYGNFWVVVTLP